MLDSDEHRLFRKTLRDLFEREIEPHVDDWEEARDFPAHELFPKLAGVGLLGLEYDEAYGGMGADHSFTVVAGEELGRISCGGVPMAIAVQMAMATPALATLRLRRAQAPVPGPGHPGRDGGVHRRHRARRRQRCGRDPHPGRARRRRVGHQRVQALHHQRDPGRLAVPAGPDLRGRRHPGHVAHRGAHLDFPGCRCRASSRSSACGRATRPSCPSTGVRVPVANTIGEIGRGFQQQMVQFQPERLITVYRHIGSIERALERTRDYLAERQAFGQPLLANQHIQFTLAELSARNDMLTPLRLRRRPSGRAAGRGRHPLRHRRQADGGPPPVRGGRHLPAVPRGHRLHGRALDVALSA